MEESWQATRYATLCCICGDKGPTADDVREARRLARAAGWWDDSFMVRRKEAVLKGSCANMMQMQAGASGHYIEHEDRAGVEQVTVCPSCTTRIRGAGDQPE